MIKTFFAFFDQRRRSRVGAVSIPAFVFLLGLVVLQANGGLAFANGPLNDEAMALNAAPNASLVITVDTAEDRTQSDIDNNGANLSKYTCGFTQGAFFFPAPDGKCTLRRAIVEASARPQSDRTDGIHIEFDIPANDPNADLEVAGTWTIQLESVLPPLKTDSIIDLNGAVTIDGSTQPGGRTDGPPIIIDSGDTSLEVESKNNTIRHISWKGGGAIFLKNKADANTVEFIWMGLTDDGQDIHFRDVNDRKRLAIGGFVIASDNNILAASVISGAFAKAVNIDGGSDNLVKNNYFGTRADGTVPEIDESVKCLASFSYDPALWYGGWGMAVSGSRNEVSGNVFLNMHIMRSTNDTSPPALEIYGADHEILFNKFGVDENDVDSGTCGHAINITGSGHDIIQNEMANTRVSFEDGEEAAMFSRDSSPLFGQNTIQGNIVRDNPGKIVIFSGTIKDSLKFFKPPRITSIDGTTLTGRAETDYPCPDCTIDLYVDDTDEIEEALVYLGQTVADSDGNFTFEMPQAMSAGFGIRTMATVNNSGVINGFGPGTTSEASQLYTPITDMEITGPEEGSVGVEYLFNIVVTPTVATQPISYTISATDYQGSTTSVLDSAEAEWVESWSSPGTKEIEVTVDNGLSSMTKTFEIEISSSDTEGGIEAITFFDSPTEGFTGEEYTINMQVQPISVTLPITYRLEITDRGAPLEALIDSRTANLAYTWDIPGTKTVRVTADNGISSFTSEHVIVISENLQDKEITDLIVEGPTTGEVGEEIVFDLVVEPVDVDLPIQFTLNVTDNDGPVGGTIDSRFATYRKTWTSSGTKTVEVTADNGISSFTTTVQIQIGSSSGTPEPSSTPSDPSGTPEPSSTPSDPSGTPEPSSTPSDPSSTPDPFATPTPDGPSSTPDPFATPTPDGPSGTSTPGSPSSSDKTIYLPMIQR